MLTLQEGAISKIDLPSGFEIREETRGGMGLNWLRRYSRDANDVSISLFYRGAPELAQFASEIGRMDAQPENLPRFGRTRAGA